MKKIYIVLITVLYLISGQFILGKQRYQHSQQHHYRTSHVFSIKGKVVDREDNPIVKAIILIPEISKSAETDLSGYFEFQQIPMGKYHLEVHKEGYMPYYSEIFNLENENLTFEVILVRKITEEIVVTATRTVKLFDEIPIKTYIVSNEEIEKKEASNLADSLCLITGVRVENNCQNCNFSQVRLNGMEGKYTQILIDSSPVISAMTGVYGLEQIPAEMIDRIEIVKGGGSALYGGNAVAGVINVITKEPKENLTSLKIHQESISGRPFTNIGVRSSLVSKDLNTKAFLFASFQRREPVDLNQDDFSDLGYLSNTSFGFNFYNYFPKINGNFKLGFFRISEERRGGDFFEKPPHQANIAEWCKTDQIGLSSEWSHYLSGKSYYNLSISFVSTKRNTYYGSHQDPNAYGNTKNPLIFFNSQFNHEIGSHLFSIGFQYKRDRIRDEAVAYQRMIDDTYHDSGFFLQDDFKISERISFLGGLRLDKHSEIRRLIFSPRMSLLYKITEDLNLRAAISTGFRAPQVFDEDLHITQVGGEGMLIVNSPGLREERSYNISIGLDFGKQIRNNLFQFSFDLFYTRLNDTFILKEIEERERARVFQRINGSGSKVYGASIDLGIILSPKFSFSSGWTIQRSFLDQPEPDFNSKKFFRTPDFYGYAKLSYENRRIFDIDLSLEYTGSMIVPHFAGYITEDRLENTEPFWVVNVRLHKHIKLAENYHTKVFIGVFNLSNSYQKDLDKGIDRDANYVYGPRKPRSFYGGVEFSF
ncbi:MAG: TonB-dependent receptor domain-containing protein [Candidatus Aminicenantia bacterium]